jgi:hypothetical protein
MARLVRPALFGLLWIAFGATTFATPLRDIDPVGAPDSNIVVPSDASWINQIVSPEQALEDLCRDAGYFLVLPDPSDSDSDSLPDFGDAFAPTQVNLTGALEARPRKAMARPTGACYYEACETLSLLARAAPEIRPRYTPPAPV